jgi:type IV pilus assembly protein PilC
VSKQPVPKKSLEQKKDTAPPQKGDAPAPIKSKKKKSGAIHLTGVSPADIEFSLRHMALMFKSGLSLTESLAVTVEQVTDERLQDTYAEILTEVQQGKSIADAMKAYPKIFTDVITSIVRVSEQTGTLETNLMFLAEYLKKSYELARKVKGALIYPIIVLSLTGGEMAGVVFFIIPKLEAMFASFENVPKFSLMVVNIAMLIRANILYVAGGFILFIIALLRFSKTKPGKRFMDKLAISFPIIRNLNRKNILASFSRTLGMLLETGIPISDAIRITGETTTNVFFSEAILEVYKEVKGGKNLADSMSVYEKYFPISFIRIIQAGEKTGTLEENLSYMYDSFSSEVEDMANNMVTLLEPIMLILAGCMIGLLAITIVAPIDQFTSSIN